MGWAFLLEQINFCDALGYCFEIKFQCSVLGEYIVFFPTGCLSKYAHPLNFHEKKLISLKYCNNVLEGCKHHYLIGEEME